MKLFVKIVPNDFKNASRDKRELLVVSELNKNIIVVAKGEVNGIEKLNGYEIHRRTTRPLRNKKIPLNINRIISVFLWIKYVKNLNADYISCHDLISLFIGWCSNISIHKRKKALLIYDSHEFEMGRNTIRKRSKLDSFFVAKSEKLLMNKCALSIMVNDSIASEVKRIHKLNKKPLVIRNIPNYWAIDESVCKIKREELCNQLKVSNDVFILMYHGAIMPGRGIENLIKVVEKSSDIVIVILGDGEESYMNYLNKLVAQIQVSEKVLFQRAVELNELWKYVGAADVGMITIPATSISYYYMLPNKLFENIQSMTPIIGSNFPEINKIVLKYDIGIVVDPNNINEISSAIEKILKDKELYNRFKQNLKKAKRELCWENESRLLKESYEKILR